MPCERGHSFVRNRCSFTHSGQTQKKKYRYIMIIIIYMIISLYIYISLRVRRTHNNMDTSELMIIIKIVIYMMKIINMMSYIKIYKI